MQAASDPFLDWVTAGPENRQFYVRRLNETKIKPLVEAFNEELFVAYAKACGWALAATPGRAASAPRSATSVRGDQFDEAMGAFRSPTPIRPSATTLH